MKIPSRTVVLLKLTVPLVAALTLTFLPRARAASTEATPAVAMPPVIQSLIATPNTITAGSSVRLRWAASGATLFTVTADNGSNPGRVSGNSLVVRPAKTTTYTVTALNTAGESVKTITVPVVEDIAPFAMQLGVLTG